MTFPELLVIVGALGGGAGLGAIVNALWSTRKEIRREPLDHKTIRVAHEVDLVGAANALVATQSGVISDLQKRIDDLEERFQRVLDELETEQRQSRDRAHELERYRLQLARRDERISDLESLVQDYGERIDLLEDALRAADIDPDDLDGTPV